MANPWFRMYSEFADDPKVQIMSECMQRRLVMLFCERCKEETLHETERAFHWRINETELIETKALFLAKGFIDEQWNLINWNTRQFISDSSTERVRQYRERLKRNETLPKREEHATVTPPDTDTDTDTEQEKPSREKNLRGEPTKSAIKKERHGLFKEKIKLYWGYKNSGVEMPWGPAEGRQLAMWLDESPNTTIEQFAAFLRNRARSDVNHAERPSRWIGNVTSYANGPLDNFKQPKNGGTNGKQVGRTEKTLSAGAGAAQDILDAGTDYPVEDNREVDGDDVFSCSGCEQGLFSDHVGSTIEGEY